MYFTFASIRKFYKVTEFPLCSNGINNNKKEKKITRYTPPRGYLNETTRGKKKKVSPSLKEEFVF